MDDDFNWSGVVVELLSGVVAVIGIWFFLEEREFAKSVGGNELASNLQWVGIGLALIGASGVLLGWAAIEGRNEDPTEHPKHSVRLGIGTSNSPTAKLPDGTPGWVCSVTLEVENNRTIWKTPACATRAEAEELAQEWRDRYKRGEILNRSEIADL